MSYHSCFLSNIGAFWGAFLGPILLIMSFNVVLFTCVIVALIRHQVRKGKSNHYESYKAKPKVKSVTVIRLLFSIGGIMAIFGLSWLFAIFTFSVTGIKDVFEILFTIFTSFQGFFIFLFFCVLNKEARDSWKQVFLYIYKKKADSSFLSSSAKHTTSTAVQSSTGSNHKALPLKTVPENSYMPLKTLNTRVASDSDMKSPSASKPGRVLGLDDIPESSTLHVGPSKPTFIT